MSTLALALVSLALIAPPWGGQGRCSCSTRPSSWSLARRARRARPRPSPAHAARARAHQPRAVGRARLRLLLVAGAVAAGAIAAVIVLPESASWPHLFTGERLRRNRVSTRLELEGRRPSRRLPGRSATRLQAPRRRRHAVDCNWLKPGCDEAARPAVLAGQSLGGGVPERAQIGGGSQTRCTLRLVSSNLTPAA